MAMLCRRPFFFLRHGETDWNNEHKVMGQTDIPLNNTGVSQALNVKKHVDALHVASVVSSFLQRAHLTALSVCGNIPVAKDERLMEADFGSIVGKHKSVYSFPHWLNGESVIEGAETGEQFIDRIVRGVNDATLLPGPVLVVAHGGVFKALLSYIAHPALKVGNCALYSFVPQGDDEKWVVTHINE